MSDTTTINVDTLSLAALDVRSEPRDWESGYGEDWDYMKAPNCPHCGDYGRLTSCDDLADEHPTAEIARDDRETWLCVNPECESFGDELTDFGEGPQMQYAYPLPDTRTYGLREAEAIAGLPLCIVRFDGAGFGGEDTHELALTGGGMDLSSAVCEAFMRLGFLPPMIFAYKMAKDLDGSESADLLAAIRRSAAESVKIAQRDAASLYEYLDRHEAKR